MAVSKVQELAQWYGYAGLAPFILFGLLVVTGMGSEDFSRLVFDGYSAVILSFLSGIYWPLALREEGPASPTRLISASIVISLLAWVALLFPPALRALSFAFGYLVLYGIDRYVMDDFWTVPYLKMRAFLTTVVIASQICVGIFG